MVGRRVMLGEVVTEVFATGFPVDEEMVGFGERGRVPNRIACPLHAIAIGKWMS
jgi:hypothetical protein